MKFCRFRRLWTQCMPVRSRAVCVSERLTKMRTGEQNGTRSWSEFVYQHEVKLYLYHEYSKAVWNRWFHVVMFTPCRNKKQSSNRSVFILYHIQIIFTPVLCIRNFKANPVLFHVVFNSYRRSVHGVILVVYTPGRKRKSLRVGWATVCWQLQTRVTIVGPTVMFLCQCFKYMSLKPHFSSSKRNFQ